MFASEQINRHYQANGVAGESHRLKDICKWAEAWFLDYIKNFHKSVKIKTGKRMNRHFTGKLT